MMVRMVRMMVKTAMIMVRMVKTLVVKKEKGKKKRAKSRRATQPAVVHLHYAAFIAKPEGNTDYFS